MLEAEFQGSSDFQVCWRGVGTIALLRSSIAFARAFQPNCKDTDVSGRNARNARCLTQGGWPNLGELLPRFASQAGNAPVIKRGRDLLAFQAFEAVDFVLLAVDIACIFDCNLHLLNNFGWQSLVAFRQIAISDLGAAENLFQ